ncbi:MAG: hypothetical protein WC081_05880 [Candidatus Ratteibacteria bacterium]|jgi:hypothetical protein
MVEINLIKERYTEPIERKERLFFFIGIFLPILFFSLAILSIIRATNKTIITDYTARVEKQGLTLTKEQRETFSPTDEEKSRQEELKKIVLFQEQRLLLTPKLVVLSDATPNHFYFNKINFEGDIVSLEGQELSGNQTMTSLSVFLEKLNGNENFTRGLNDLKFEQIGEEAGTFNFRIVGTKK